MEGRIVNTLLKLKNSGLDDISYVVFMLVILTVFKLGKEVSSIRQFKGKIVIITYFSLGIWTCKFSAKKTNIKI